jgi:ElaB/YqjD/DUF883 family membrane-anchored ribosome-binding protein
MNQSPPTDDTVKQYELELARKRERLADSVAQLRQRVTAVSHWRTHVREHPQAALVLALAAGWMVGLWWFPRRRYYL